MNIRQHILIAINDGLSAQRIVRNGVPGVLFTGADEPTEGAFIPFEHLGVNPKFGYFDMRQFPGQPTDCVNDNPETIHEMLGADGWRPLAWAQEESGIVTLLGETWQVADLYQALRAHFEHGALGEPLDEGELDGGLTWLQAADAAYFASRANPERFPSADDPQLADAIRRAGTRKAIRTRIGESGRTYYERSSVEEWARRNETRGRPRERQQEAPPKPWRDDPATDKQIARLRSYGIDPAGMTKGQASDMIEQRKDLVQCWECGHMVPRSQAEWDGNGWYCGC